ncbi:hypothetical protein HYR69_02885, partial [Candidatus Sumerlaeota bacterium]|nr:hypothetical protein [Candidatus Sumerlaeota bacterium]
MAKQSRKLNLRGGTRATPPEIFSFRDAERRVTQPDRERAGATKTKRRTTQIKAPLRVNDKIRAREVRLIDAKGVQLGLIPLEEAIDKAKKQELDLVEVSPDSDPPVCKI